MTTDHHAPRGWTKPKKLSAEQLQEIARRAFIGQPVFNINSLDPNDARGVEEVIDWDREQAMRDDELIETPSGEQS